MRKVQKTETAAISVAVEVKSLSLQEAGDRGPVYIIPVISLITLTVSLACRRGNKYDEGDLCAMDVTFQPMKDAEGEQSQKKHKRCFRVVLPAS